MLDPRKFRGNFAEGVAINFLKQKKFIVITSNYRYRGGEIDIIGYDKDEKELVFVEVRSKWCREIADNWRKSAIIPEDTVNFIKLRKIEKTAWYFLEKENRMWQPYFKNLPIYSFPEWRIDLVSVTISRPTEQSFGQANADCQSQIRHYKYLFS